MALDSCLNFIRLNEGNSIKFCICIDIDKLWVVIVMYELVEIYKRVMVFKSCYNFVTAPFYINEWWNLTNPKFINVRIWSCWNTSLNFVNVNESITPGTPLILIQWPRRDICVTLTHF